MVSATQTGEDLLADATVEPRIGRRGAIALAALGAVAAVVAVWQGVPLAAGLVLGVCFVALALCRFEWFMWVVLLVRPVVDLTKSGGAAAGSSTVATLLGGAVLVVGLSWLAALSRQRSRLPMGIVSRSLVLLLATSLVSVALSLQPGTSALQVARTSGAVMVLLVLEQLLRSRAMAVRALVVCGLSAIFPLVVGALQLLVSNGPRTPDGLSRLTGSFTHPNTFGFFLALVLLMAYAVRPHVHGRPRWAINALLVVAGVELVFTYSRGAWLVLGLGLLVIGVFADRRIFLAVPVVIGVVLVAVPNVQARLTDLANADTVGGRPGNSASWRLAHLQDLLSLGGDPYFGVGPKMTDLLAGDGRAPHNDAIRMLVENGAVGLACYSLFLLSLLVLAYRALRRLRSGFGKGLAVGFAACMLAFIADSMGDNLITQFVLLIYVLGLVAVVQAWLRTDPGAAPGAEPSRSARGTGSDRPADSRGVAPWSSASTSD